MVLPHTFLSLVCCEQIETLPYGCGILRVETKFFDSKFHSMTPYVRATDEMKPAQIFPKRTHFRMYPMTPI
jgi:hypothetical protein